MEHITDIILSRRSVRTFDGRELNTDDKEKLYSFTEKIENPYGIPVKFKFMNAKEDGLICPVAVGTDLYIGGKTKRVPHAEEAFGYSFEMLVLYAQSLKIGTVWLGGTMNRSAFEKAMDISEDEMMPCASPLGYPAEKMSFRENMMRKGIKADERLPFETLFFDGTFDAPLSESGAKKLANPLKMVRQAPSAVNKQPWRAVVTEDSVHFYLKRSLGHSGGAAGDLQKIDLGIALCHFDLAAKEDNIPLTFSLKNPGIKTDTDTEYIASYLIG